MKMVELKPRGIPIKRRDMGIAGAVIVLSQFISNFQSSHTVSSEILKFKEEFQESKVEREQYFVRKTDLVPVLSKLDRLNDQMIKLNEKVSSLKQIAESEKWMGGDETIGCDLVISKSINEADAWL